MSLARFRLRPPPLSPEDVFACGSRFLWKYPAFVHAMWFSYSTMSSHSRCIYHHSGGLSSLIWCFHVSLHLLHCVREVLVSDPCYALVVISSALTLCYRSVSLSIHSRHCFSEVLSSVSTPCASIHSLRHSGHPFGFSLTSCLCLLTRVSILASYCGFSPNMPVGSPLAFFDLGSHPGTLKCAILSIRVVSEPRCDLGLLLLHGFD